MNTRLSSVIAVALSESPMAYPSHLKAYLPSPYTSIDKTYPESVFFPICSDVNSIESVFMDVISVYSITLLKYSPFKLSITPLYL